MSRRYLYEHCEVTKIVDGDTIDVRIVWDIGFEIEAATKQRLRFAKINAPETNRAAEKVAGLASKAWLMDRIAVGDVVQIETFQDDAFGRYIAMIWSEDGLEFDMVWMAEPGEALNDQMVAAGHAVYKDY